MPAITTAEQLKTLYLSAAELKVLTDWPDTLIEDYLNILSNISMLGEKADDSSDNVQLIHSLISSTDRVRRGLNKQAKEIIEVEQADKSTSRPIRYHQHIPGRYRPRQHPDYSTEITSTYSLNLSGITGSAKDALDEADAPSHIWRFPFGIESGADGDVSFTYDGTDAILKTDEVAPSDLIVSCGTDKTIELTETVWDDLNFDPASSGGPPVSLPDYVTINNVYHREFTSANNQTCGDGEEIPHPYKLSTTVFPHMHIFLKGGESAGTTGVTFTFYWELRQPSGTTSGSVTLSATSAQLTANPHIFSIFDATGFAGPSVTGGQLSCRIDRTAGDAGDVVVTTYGVHYEIDTIGSRQISTK